MAGEFCRATSENSKQPTYGREWGKWIEWDGSPRYGPDTGEVEAFVQVHRRSPNSDHFLVAESHHIDWIHNDTIHDVLAYRVEKQN